MSCCAAPSTVPDPGAWYVQLNHVPASNLTAIRSHFHSIQTERSVLKQCSSGRMQQDALPMRMKHIETAVPAPTHLYVVYILQTRQNVWRGNVIPKLLSLPHGVLEHI